MNNASASTQPTTLFITSELEEAIFLADQLLFMSASPGRIIESMQVDLPHPRTFETDQRRDRRTLEIFLLEHLQPERIAIHRERALEITHPQRDAFDGTDQRGRHNPSAPGFMT